MTKDLYKGIYCSGALVPFADLEKEEWGRERTHND
jgi:hypothetical protein